MNESNTTSIQNTNQNPILSVFNFLFNSSVITTEEVDIQYLEGTVTGYNKSYKADIQATSQTSSQANKIWNIAGYASRGNLSLNTYLSTTLTAESTPVVDFWLQYEDDAEESYTVTKDVLMRQGQELRLSYLTIDRSGFYLYEIENKNAKSRDVLIPDNELANFVKGSTKNYFSYATGLIAGLLLFLSKGVFFAIFGLFITYYTTKKYMQRRNLGILKNRIVELKTRNR